jgi:hypothetical protein
LKRKSINKKLSKIPGLPVNKIIKLTGLPVKKISN